MVTDEDRLSEGNVFHDGVHFFAGVLGILGSTLAVIFKAFGPLRGTFNQRFILVADLATEFEKQIFPLRCPHGGNEKLLSGSP